MLTIQQISVKKTDILGTPGSGSILHSFVVQMITRPKMEAYRVAIRWTPDGWRTTYQTEAGLASGESLDQDMWDTTISSFSTYNTSITFHYALVAVGPNGLVWDNNNGWNYTI